MIAEMINEDGAEEKLPSVVTPSFGPAFEQESDGGDDLSQNSSCGGGGGGAGGESEFERYCSANSVLGTPSFCGTSFYDESEFGSLKSFKLGDEIRCYKNFGVERKLSDHGGCSSYDQTNAFYEKNNNGLLNLYGGVNSDDEFVGDLDISNEDVNENGNLGSNDGNVRISREVLCRENKCDACSSLGNMMEGEEGRKCDENEAERCSDEGESAPRYEHSEGEDSMFGCGSDDEKKFDFYFQKNVECNREGIRRNENSLVMNSTVAFGSNDWDDFVQESAYNDPFSIVQDEHQGDKQEDTEIDLALPDLSSSKTIQIPNRDDRVGDESVVPTQVQHGGTLEVTDCLGTSPGSDVFGRALNTLQNQAVIYDEFKTRSTESELERQCTDATGSKESEHQYLDATGSKEVHSDTASENLDLQKTNLPLDLLYSSAVGQHYLASSEDRKTKPCEDESLLLTPATDKNSNAVTTENSAIYEDHFAPFKVKHVRLNEFYDEVVDDMEEILLDSGESPGSRFAQDNRAYQSQFSRPSRDGGSTASTSGTDDAYHSTHQTLRIDEIEVVGARQKKGDVSLSERLVGVKEYTVYRIRVRSGDDYWEVERRYRDFSTLYRRLKKLFADQGWILPSPWTSVERETKKIFVSASPDVIADRSLLIQECLRSVLHLRLPSRSINALIRFLSPFEAAPSPLEPGTSVPQSSFCNSSMHMENVSTLGKTVSLIVEAQPHKSIKQILDAQHYACAGCHKNFDDGKTRVQEFVQALGWGKPRLCEYSGQLYCSSCHNNDTAVLPARVLHFWDFAQYPVSQFSKLYLDSIYDQPMLCVSAVNPFLFSKVPTLQHATNIRNKIRTMLPYVRCPFRRTIFKGLGSRRYLLESNDFFALKDLVDLSKGVFSALPVMIETVSRKIEEHITEQCLICCDMGIPCSARQACSDPSSLIFPFQEGEVEKCSSCKSMFHKNCFKKVAACPCGAPLNPEAAAEVTYHDVNSDLLQRHEEPSGGLLTGLFSKLSIRRSHGLNEQASNNENVILMGSLPSNSI